MNLKKLLVTLAVLASIVPGSLAFAQASVNESESLTLYVNPSTGSDAAAGTSSTPKKTIQSALNLALSRNAQGIGVKVMVAPGTYRESITITKTTNAALTVQASTAGAAIIDGANVLTNYYSAGGGVYNYTWADTVSGCALPSGWYGGMPPVAIANEMVFVNGDALTQVMAASQLRAGTFYVNKGSKEIQLYPPTGTTISSAKVEVAARRTTLTVNDGKNLVFRGMSFQHAASCMNVAGANINSSNNVLFDNDTVDWNNWSGLGINSSTNITVENTTAEHNGGAGLAGFRVTTSAWTNNKTNYNNWRGAMVGLYDFAQAGTKLMHMHTVTVSGQEAYDNAAQGLWFDTDNENVTVNGAKLVGNIVGNLQLELNQGPITVENSSFCSGAGVQILETDGLTMKDNHFYNNGGTSFQNGQFFLAGQAGGREMTNWATGQSSRIVTKNVTLTGNTFTALGSGEYVFNTYLGGSDWSTFLNSLNSNDNHWYNSSTTSDFSIVSNKKVNLSSWRSLSGLDESSSWSVGSDSTSGCGVPTTTYPDFQLQAHNAAAYVASYTMTSGKLTIPLQLKSFNYGTVSLSAVGLPSGVSASFSSASLVSGSPTMTLTASKSASYAKVPVTIVGKSGNRVHTITLWVNVRPA